MSLFRSKDMNLFKMIMNKDQEYSIVSVIGEQDMAHFVDMNGGEEVFRLPYVDALQRCESTERKVQFVLKECQKLNITLK